MTTSASLRTVFLLTAALCATGAYAQNNPAKSNLLGLSVQSSVKAPQDYLSITLDTTQEGTTGPALQAELKKTLDQALALAKAQEKGDALKVRTGQFRVSPVYDSKDRKITGWRGNAQLILEGKDMVRIATLANNIPNMPVQSSVFGLSRESREKYEADAQRQAVADFRAKAQVLTQQFGFATYGIEQLQVTSSQEYVRPVMMAAASNAMSMSKMAGPLPIEAGETAVSVDISGTVQMR